MKIAEIVKVVSIVLLYLIIGIWYYLNKTKETQIVYVDSSKLLDQTVKVKQLRTTIEKKKLQYKYQVDTLVAEFQNDLKKYEKDLKGKSEKERENFKSLLQKKQTDIQNYQQAGQQRVMQEEQDEMKIIFTEINAAISNYGKKKGYKMILATSNGNIAYADPSTEVTDEIIKVVNESVK